MTKEDGRWLLLLPALCLPPAAHTTTRCLTLLLLRSLSLSPVGTSAPGRWGAPVEIESSVKTHLQKMRERQLRELQQLLEMEKQAEVRHQQVVFNTTTDSTKL